MCGSQYSSESVVRRSNTSASIDDSSGLVWQRSALEPMAVKSIRLSAHAKLQAEKRHIAERLVQQVVETPEQVLSLRPGRETRQSRIRAPTSGTVYLIRVVTDDELRSDLVSRGLTRAGLFTWARTARATMNVYKQVIRVRS